jgi:valyl-tRNA synthetase
MDGVQPFHTVALHGLVRDKFGKKMSKIAAMELIPLNLWISTVLDALRFTLARGANPGTDQALAEEWVGGARNFASKLWNATRFALMNGATVEGALPSPSSLGAIDRWILSRLNETIEQADEFFENYEFATCLRTDLSLCMG